jgi:hypothetical protein
LKRIQRSLLYSSLFVRKCASNDYSQNSIFFSETMNIDNETYGIWFEFQRSSLVLWASLLNHPVVPASDGRQMWAINAMIIRKKHCTNRKNLPNFRSVHHKSIKEMKPGSCLKNQALTTWPIYECK